MSFAPTIAAADIGSVAKNKFGWAVQKPDKEMVGGTDIVEFVRVIVAALDESNPVALGFECPLFVPVRENPVGLTGARAGEGSRAWCAGAGAGALATGLTETAWILREILRGVNTEPKLSVRWKDFERSRGLFLWEAFVTGNAKSETHAGDAELALKAFQRSLPTPERSNLIEETSVLSLVGASALWAGWRSDASLLKESCLVIAA